MPLLLHTVWYDISLSLSSCTVYTKPSPMTGDCNRSLFSLALAILLLCTVYLLGCDQCLSRLYTIQPETNTTISVALTATATQQISSNTFCGSHAFASEWIKIERWWTLCTGRPAQCLNDAWSIVTECHRVWNLSLDNELGWAVFVAWCVRSVFGNCRRQQLLCKRQCTLRRPTMYTY